MADVPLADDEQRRSELLLGLEAMAAVAEAVEVVVETDVTAVAG